MITEIVSKAIKSIVDLILNILSILPNSPFSEFMSVTGGFSEMLPYINWFIPFDFCLMVLSVWVCAVGAYYIYKYAKDISEFLGGMKK